MVQSAPLWPGRRQYASLAALYQPKFITSPARSATIFFKAIFAATLADISDCWREDNLKNYHVLEIGAKVKELALVVGAPENLKLSNDNGDGRHEFIGDGDNQMH